MGENTQSNTSNNRPCKFPKRQSLAIRKWNRKSMSQKAYAASNSDDCTAGEHHRQAISTLLEGENRTDEPLKVGVMTVKSRSNNAKSYKKRTFYLGREALHVVKRRPVPLENTDVLDVVCDLSMAKVKFCDNPRKFNIFTPSESFVGKCKTPEECASWVSAMQEVIRSVGIFTNSDQINKNLHIDTDKLSPFARVPGCEVCCDCGSRDVTWISVNLGATVCINCSGAHRALGVRYSRIRSVQMDKWSIVFGLVIDQLGNRICNKVYGQGLVFDADNISDSYRSDFIRGKYVARKNVLPLNRAEELLDDQYDKESYHAVLAACESHDADLALYEATRIGDLKLMLHALANDANINWENTSEDSMTPLHCSVIANKPLCCLYLMLNDALRNPRDVNGNTPLHLAGSLNSSIHACLLLVYNSSLSDKNNEGKTALDLATEQLNVDVVVIVKVALLSKELGDMNKLEEKAQAYIAEWLKNYNSSKERKVQVMTN